MSGIGSLLFTLFSINFYASPRYTKGTVGEPFLIDVVIEGEHLKGMEEPSHPQVKGFKFLNVSVSTSTSISIINGKLTSSYKKSYTFTYLPTKEGTFTIPPFTITYKGKTYKTEPFQVVITRRKNIATESAPTIALGPIFIRTILSRERVYRGEGIMVEYKLYSIKPITGIDIVSMPDYSNFWKEEVYTPKALETKIEILNGRRYHTITLKKILLYPLETGKVSIPTPVYAVQVSSGDFFDIFGKTYNITAEERTIKVKPLPEPVPEGFTGGVGSFNVKAYFEKDTVMTGEGTNLILKVKGRGNIRFITAPKIKSSSGLHIYTPEENVKAKSSENGETGEKTFKYLIVPSTPGIKSCGKIKFTYFSPEKKRYITEEIELPELVVYTMPGKEGEKKQVEGMDIAYIKTDFPLRRYSLFPIWVPYLLILLTLSPIIAALLDLERKKREKDKGYARLKTLPLITKKALKRLKRAINNKNTEEFLKILHNLLIDFVKHRFNVESYGMTIKEIEDLLHKKNVPPDTVYDFISLLKMCEELRFLPDRKDLDLESMYKKTREVIGDIA